MQKYLIKNIRIVNEGQITTADVLIKNGRIEKIAPQITRMNTDYLKLMGKASICFPAVLMTRCIFGNRATHKATIYTESKAAVAGGVTSFMEMPNTIPTCTHTGIAGR